MQPPTSFPSGLSYHDPQINGFSAKSLSHRYIGFSVAVSLMTIIYISTNFGLFFSNLLLPLPIVIIEPILFVLWAIVVAAIGIGNTDALNSSCVSDYDYTTLEACILLKAGFGVSTLELFVSPPNLITHLIEFPVHVS